MILFALQHKKILYIILFTFLSRHKLNTYPKFSKLGFNKKKFEVQGECKEEKVLKNFASEEKFNSQFNKKKNDNIHKSEAQEIR